MLNTSRCIVRLKVDIEPADGEKNACFDIQCEVVSGAAKEQDDQAGGAGQSRRSDEMVFGERATRRSQAPPEQAAEKQSVDRPTAFRKIECGDFVEREKTADIEELPRAIKVAMTKALSLQESINDEDLEWLRSRQDLDQNVRNEVFARMVARGGLFLNLIEKLIGFDNGYDRLPTPADLQQPDVPRFVPR